MLNGMAKDFSWTASAREYVKVYERLSPPKSMGQEKVLEFSRA
jgi:glycogen synthase